MTTKYIFVTGGVVSSLGKGVASASIGALLESRGFKVTLMKFDPYVNVDPGTMSPYQHGEVFVTDDGAETDLDLGHYERFTGVPARGHDSVTAGANSDCTPITCVRGERSAATRAVPQMPLPRPTGTRITSGSGNSSKISSA